MAEILSFLFFAWMAFVVVAWVLRVLKAIVDAGGTVIDTTAGDGSLTENWNKRRGIMGDFEIRLRDGTLEDDSTVQVKIIEARGLFPVYYDVEANLVVTAFDTTDTETMPVFTVFEALQEAETIAMRIETPLAVLQQGYGFTSWVELGAVPPDILCPPHSGRREITLAVLLVDARNSPPSHLGFIDADNHPGVLWANVVSFRHRFSDDGYSEASEKREASLRHTIAIAMAVAMVDGTLDKAEGQAIQSWANKLLESYDEEQREEKKAIINDAMRSAHAAVRDGSLSIDSAIDALNELNQKAPKYETIKLCFDVMSADGVADPAELKLIRSVSERLQLDFNEVERMRDSAVLQLDATVAGPASLEDMLGIDPSWDRDRIQRHIENEFMKWNGRLGAITNHDERAQAQRMIDLCGEAEMKYG